MTRKLARFALADPVTVLVSPYVDWWDESQESGVVPEPIQGQTPVVKSAPVESAAGVDTHPGGEQLKHYWLHGEGAAKWSTWTELYHHLLEYLSPGMAKRTAAEWYHLRFGIWPGSDKNRVMHGKPPRGDVVGPG